MTDQRMHAPGRNGAPVAFPARGSNIIALVLSLLLTACLAGLLRLALPFVPLPPVPDDADASVAGWVRSFDATRHLNSGGTKGTALLTRGLAERFPIGSDAASLHEALRSAGFAFAGFNKPGRWQGCRIDAYRRKTFLGVIRVKVDHAAGVIRGLKADMSFPAVVW